MSITLHYLIHQQWMFYLRYTIIVLLKLGYVTIISFIALVMRPFTWTIFEHGGLFKLA